MSGEHSPGGPNPEEASFGLADLKAAAARYADNEAKGIPNETRAEHDERVTTEVEKNIDDEPEWAEAAQEVSEDKAREHLAEVHAKMAGQAAVLAAETAIERPEDIITSQAMATLKHNISTEGPGQLNLMTPGIDDDLHRKAIDQIFGGLGLNSPLPELTADKRGWLRKLIRPKNRKTTEVSKAFETADGLSGVITATRSYNKIHKQYEVRLHGGNG